METLSNGSLQLKASTVQGFHGPEHTRTHAHTHTHTHTNTHTHTHTQFDHGGNEYKVGLAPRNVKKPQSTDFLTLVATFFAAGKHEGKSDTDSAVRNLMCGGIPGKYTISEQLYALHGSTIVVFTSPGVKHVCCLPDSDFIPGDWTPVQNAEGLTSHLEKTNADGITTTKRALHPPLPRDTKTLSSCC